VCAEVNTQFAVEKRCLASAAAAAAAGEFNASTAAWNKDVPSKQATRSIPRSKSVMLYK
jgi:hypothetical protein